MADSQGGSLAPSGFLRALRWVQRQPSRSYDSFTCKLGGKTGPDVLIISTRPRSFTSRQGFGQFSLSRELSFYRELSWISDSGLKHNQIFIREWQQGRLEESTTTGRLQTNRPAGPTNVCQAPVHPLTVHQAHSKGCVCQTELAPVVSLMCSINKGLTGVGALIGAGAAQQ